MQPPVAELLDAPDSADAETAIAVERERRPAAESSSAPDSAVGLQLVELELALDSLEPGRNGFAEAIGSAMRSLGGDFLFSLPAAGLAEGFQKIAVVRLPGDDAAALAFVLLSEDGTSISVRRPDEETMGLAKFSKAFIDLLERL